MVVNSSFIPDNRSILLIQNHFSWWDGFFAWFINKNLLKKKFHLLMLEKELSKRKFFSRVGAYSIRKNSKEILQSIEFTSKILENHGNVVVVFPQGKLGSQHHWNIVFEKGIERIMKKSENTCLLFVVCLTDYYAHRKPTVTFHLKEYIGEMSIKLIEEEYNLFLKQSILLQDNIYTT